MKKDPPNETSADPTVHSPNPVDVAQLKPHPRNYRLHPEDQMRHLEASLREHGMYRNIVTAEDYTILAGHGVVQAAKNVGIKEVPVIRLPIKPNDPRALKILAGDNEVLHMGVVDDRALVGLLDELRQSGDDGLLGTGFDEMMLANLLLVTRREEEVPDLQSASMWVGLPAWEKKESGTGYPLILHFDDEAAREKLIEQIGVFISNKDRKTWSAYWPPRPRADAMSLRWDTPEEQARIEAEAEEPATTDVDA